MALECVVYGTGEHAREQWGQILKPYAHFGLLGKGSCCGKHNLVLHQADADHTGGPQLLPGRTELERFAVKVVVRGGLHHRIGQG